MVQKILTAALIGAAMATAACNTVRGVGEDVSATGDAVADAAEDAKN